MYKIETLIFNPIFNHYAPVVGMPEWIDLETLSTLELSEPEEKNVFGLIRICQDNQIILDTFTDKIVGLWFAVAKLLLACLEEGESTLYLEERLKNHKI